MATIGWGTTGADTDLPWSGNSTLTDLSIVSSALQVSYAEHEADATTKALYHLNESAWSGADSALDSSGGDNHLTPSGSPSPAAAWMGNGFAGNGTDYLIRSSNAGMTQRSATVECWYYMPVADAKGCFAYYGTDSGGAGIGIGSASNWWDATGRRVVILFGGILWRATPSDLTAGWHHCALTIDADGMPRIWVDGTLQYTGAQAQSRDPGASLCVGAQVANSRRVSGGAVDEVRFSNAIRYTDTFAPTRYHEYGTAVAGNNTLAGTLTSVSWASTESGDNEGDVAVVEVYSGGSWVQVGGDSPTSPVEGLSLAVATGDLLRFRLNSKADAMRSESPILTSATATITAGGVALPLIAQGGTIGRGLINRSLIA